MNKSQLEPRSTTIERVAAVLEPHQPIMTRHPEWPVIAGVEYVTWKCACGLPVLGWLDWITHITQVLEREVQP